ncbi:MAG: hypothetical protein WDM70_05740 [Nitrosomonadales bacterium]
MLTLNAIGARIPAKQKGVTLMLTLIMLVIMTLSAIALIRSTDTTNLIAGNVAFQQGATNSGEQGVEAAAFWLGQQLPASLYNSIPASGYSAVSYGPVSTSNWWQWWSTNSGAAISLPTDAAGNTVSYLIERLCNQAGNPVGIPASGVAANVCERPPPFTLPGGNNSYASDTNIMLVSGAVYYRITSHVQGVKNTQSLVQVIMSQ